VVLDTPALRHTRNVAYGETPSVASDGTDFLVVWSTNTPDGGLDITGSRITAGGSILDPQGLPITDSPVFEVGPVLASNSDTYLVAWEENERRPAQRYRYFPYALAFENERIRGALLTRTGAAHDAGVLLLSPPSGERSSAGIGTNGTDYLVAWQDKRSNPSFDLYGARVTADGLVQDVDGGFLISGRYQHEVLPAISATGNGDYLIAYSQHTGRWTSWRVKARVLDVNGPPVPTTLRLTTTEEAPLALSLTATDPENDALTFSIRRPPSHGTLTGTPPQLVYTPAPDFSGVDDFEFRVTDGTSTSRPGLVSLTVTPVNDAPTVDDLELSFRQGDAIAFTLPARDVDQDALQYRLVSQPSSGLLGGTPPTLTWQPPAGFRGTASVRFRVSDGVLDGPREGTVRWTVTNGPPTVSASAMPAMTTEGEPVRFVATASDPGHDSLALSWDFGDGATAQGETVTHVYEGTGRFVASVTASDGLARTTRTLDVDVANGAPRLRVSMPVVASEGEVVSLRAEVMDGQPTAALVEWQFSDGSPAVQGAAVTHLFPDDGRFTVTVLATDALGATRRVERDISVFNVSPTPATPPTLQVRAGERATTTLTANDPAGARDALTWTLLRGPGSLTSAGVYEWRTTATDAGRFSIEARVADDDEGAAVVRFDVDVLPSSSAPMGCACTSASGGVDLLLVVWAMRRWRRRQVRASQVTPAPPRRG
jgi:chitodextrinase